MLFAAMHEFVPGTFLPCLLGRPVGLITGPANAKTELVKHIHQHAPRQMNFIAGVETVDHPSDVSLVAYARKYFKAADLMQPQKP